VTDDNIHARIQSIRQILVEQLIGHDNLIDRLLIAILTGGHLLIEGAPGLAKTRAVHNFAKLLDINFVRIQATPDLLPADLTGTDVFDQTTSQFRFLAGPLFNQVVLVDEVNRAPPKVQSALLEAMGEKQISIGGTTRPLAEPFLVAATQNPIEHEGTYPLPEAQLDRFMFFVQVNMPDAVSSAEKLVSLADLEAARLAVADVYISDAVRDYIVRLVAATRGEGAGGQEASQIAHPASPRGSIALALGSQAHAWLQGRDYVTPDDVLILALDVLCGRISLSYRARAEGITQRAVIERIINATPKV